jgi:hypothetical protein
MTRPNDPRTPPPFADPQTASNASAGASRERLLNAISPIAYGHPGRDRVSGGVQDESSGHLRLLQKLSGVDGLTRRDSDALYLTVLLRLLPHRQLHELAFDAQDASILRRRARRMEERGWVNAWDAAKERGGRERYLHPTAKALAWALDQFRTATEREPWHPLIRLMLPKVRVPLQLAPGTRPKWLPHQREVNKIVTRMITRGRSPVLWASTWDCPFPNSVEGFTMPQPDYVLVEERGGAPYLVFGEHDRGTERIEKFVARKVDLYAAIASLPNLAEQVFGLRTFEVRVSVIDTRLQRPVERLRALAAAAAKTHAPLRYTLGGWLHASPGEAIWFDSAQLPEMTQSDTPITSRFLPETAGSR